MTLRTDTIETKRDAKSYLFYFIGVMASAGPDKHEAGKIHVAALAYKIEPLQSKC